MEAEARTMEFIETNSWSRVMHDVLAADEGEWLPFRMETKASTKEAIRNTAAHSSYRHLRPRGFTFALRILGEPKAEKVDMLIAKQTFPIYPKNRE